MIRWWGDQLRAFGPSGLRPRSGVVSSPKAHSEFWFSKVWFVSRCWRWSFSSTNQVVHKTIQDEMLLKATGEDDFCQHMSSHSRSLWFLSARSFAQCIAQFAQFAQFAQCIATCHFVQSWPRERSNCLKVDIWETSNIWALPRPHKQNETRVSMSSMVTGVKHSFALANQWKNH